MNKTSKTNRRIMAILLVAAGLFMIAVAPFLVQSTLDPMLEGLMKRAAEDPRFASGPTLMAIFYPLWRALIMVAGVACLVLALPTLKGEQWTWPASLALLAVPAIGGMYMMLPFVSFVKDAMPPSIVITLVGLAGYWGVLLLKRSTRTQKAVNWLVFTLLGVITTESFVLGFGAMRQLMARPNSPLFVDAKIAILTIGGPVNWIGAALVFAAIPLLAARKPLGWWFGLIAGLSIAIAGVPTHFVRQATADYLIGAVLGVVLVVVLLVPAVKQQLIGPPEPKAAGV
ncbi:MAG: hypothetical protein ACP5JJ_05415 [Anaerolineae bacterium]